MDKQHYIAALDKIELSKDRQKQIAQKAMTADIKPKATVRPVAFWVRVCSAAAVVVAVLCTGVWLLNYGLDFKPDTNENVTKVFPSIGYGSVTYRYHGDSSYDILPEGFVAAGQIVESNKDDQLDHLEATMVKVGTTVYCHPDNPHSLFVSDFMGSDGYSLFVDYDLLCNAVMLDGQVYSNMQNYSDRFDSRPWQGDEFTFAGNIGDVCFHAMPSKQLQSNILFSEGAQVYVNQRYDTLYVRMTNDNGVEYIKLIPYKSS